MSQKSTSGTSQVPTRWVKSDVTSYVLRASQEYLDFGTPEELVNGTVDPEAFITAESFRRAYWKTEMFSKFPFPNIGVDREAAARQSFNDAEEVCGSSNARLVDLFNRTDVPEGIRRVLLQARLTLARLFAGFSVNEIAENCRWGPGSSTSLPARFATPQNKWVLSSHITLAATPYLDAFVGWSGWIPIVEPTIVEGNVVVFVPKNAKTDRSIAIEPDWNSFFQLGLGGAIRNRLQRWGVLLPIAQSINKRLARNGSIDGFLATVDLKAASDTISLALVEALLPPDVLEHVLALRSPKGSLDGGETWFTYEKVSSMGNGFTFELETALFWAISRAVAGHACVYGDDIVVPSTCVSWLQEVLTYCGFTMNTKKSHSSGPFRESCGGHYFKGVDVSPVYVRKPLIGVSRVAFLNNLKAAIDAQLLYEYQPLWAAASRGIPDIFRGPSDVDGAVHDEFTSSRPLWWSRLQCWTGFRLVRRYDLGQSLALGGLRTALFSRSPEGTRIEFSHQRSPGTPKDTVTKWYSTKWPKVESYLSRKRRSRSAGGRAGAP